MQKIATTYKKKLLILFFIVITRNPYGRSNRFAAALFFCFAAWDFCEMFLYNPSTPQYIAYFFDKFEVPAWTSFPVFIFWLMVSLTEKKDLFNSAVLKAVSFALPIFFIVLDWSGNLMHHPVLMGHYWHTDWIENSVFPYLFFIYYPACVIGGLVYYAISLKKGAQGFKKKQAIVLYISTAVTLAVGTFFEVIKPMMHLDIGIFDYFNNMYLMIWALGLFIIIFR